MQYTAYKYRIYPTKEQETLLNKTFGCVRYVYNRALARKTELYKTEKKGISMFALMDEMVDWKRREDTIWLKEVNSQALQMSLRNLDMAYTRFFKEKKGFPKFKSKHDNNHSFCNPQGTKVDFESKKVFIPKFNGGIKCIFHRQFEGKIKSSTVIKTPTGKYFISILVEEDVLTVLPPKTDENKTLGIDLGIKTYATFSDGTKIENPRHLNKKLKQLKQAQRKLSRKKKGSKNRDKQRKKVAVIHEKVTNCRKDFLHKVTKSLVDNQNYDSLAIEDLNVSEMIQKGKRNKLSKHISDAGWGMFRQFLTYKCERYGKNLLVIGRFEPSSKLCSCGKLNKKLTLDIREWTCDTCGMKHDRDTLAAQNIKRFAFCKQSFASNKQNFNHIPQELREFTPLETRVSGSLKKEVSTALA